MRHIVIFLSGQKQKHVFEVQVMTKYILFKACDLGKIIALIERREQWFAWYMYIFKGKSGSRKMYECLLLPAG